MSEASAATQAISNTIKHAVRQRDGGCVVCLEDLDPIETTHIFDKAAWAHFMRSWRAANLFPAYERSGTSGLAGLQHNMKQNLMSSLWTIYCIAVLLLSLRCTVCPNDRARYNDSKDHHYVFLPPFDLLVEHIHLEEADRAYRQSQEPPQILRSYPLAYDFDSDLPVRLV